MTITVYRRRFPVDGGPVSLSFVPFDRRPRYTLVVGDRVHESVFEEIDIVAPAEAKLNRITNRLSCHTRVRVEAPPVRGLVFFHPHLIDASASEGPPHYEDLATLVHCVRRKRNVIPAP